mgnify:CR=1 FL=1
MKSGYKCSAKRIAAIGVMLCMLVLTCLTVTSVLNTKAEESIGQGHVNYDVTGLRIRKGCPFSKGQLFSMQTCVSAWTCGQMQFTLRNPMA